MFSNFWCKRIESVRKLIVSRHSDGYIFVVRKPLTRSMCVGSSGWIPTMGWQRFCLTQTRWHVERVKFSNFWYKRIESVRKLIVSRHSDGYIFVVRKPLTRSMCGQEKFLGYKFLKTRIMETESPNWRK